MITTTVHDDRTRTVSYYGRLLGHYGPVRYNAPTPAHGVA